MITRGRTSHRALPAVLALLLLAAACGEPGDPSTGSHIGNPGTLSFVATSALAMPLEPAAPPPQPVSFEDDRGTRYTLTEAGLGLRRVELYLPAGVSCMDLDAASHPGVVCDDLGEKLVIEGERVVDLLAASAEPPWGDIGLPALSYPRLDYRPEELDALMGRSFQARASFIAPDGTPAELVLILDLEDDVRVEAPGGATLPEGGVLRVELGAARWLQGIPLAECLESGELAIVDGVLRLDDEEDPCDAVEDAIEDNLEASGALRAYAGDDDDP